MCWLSTRVPSQSNNTRSGALEVMSSPRAEGLGGDIINECGFTGIHEQDPRETASFTLPGEGAGHDEFGRGCSRIIEGHHKGLVFRTGGGDRKVQPILGKALLGFLGEGLTLFNRCRNNGLLRLRLRGCGLCLNSACPVALASPSCGQAGGGAVTAADGMLASGAAASAAGCSATDGAAGAAAFWLPTSESTHHTPAPASKATTVPVTPTRTRVSVPVRKA